MLLVVFEPPPRACFLSPEMRRTYHISCAIDE